MPTDPPTSTPAPGPATALGAIRAVLALPALVGLIMPVIIAVADPWRRPLELPSIAIGGVLFVAGIAIAANTARDFFTIGRGTLAPWDPPRQLVSSGLFAHCRNPMYIGVLAVVAALAMASRSPLLGVYLLATAVGFHLRVVRWEEPRLADAFADDWARYRAAVPRWIPRLRSRTSPPAA